MVDILGVDIILDMDELTAIELSVIGTLTLVDICMWLDAYVCGISGRNSF